MSDAIGPCRLGTWTEMANVWVNEVVLNFKAFFHSLLTVSIDSSSIFFFFRHFYLGKPEKL
uniref:Uncharacterized protein n=1 Tax=Anguilla anguilla TaxID=7936 RepID=A0A0E9QXU7_ANGAN